MYLPNATNEDVIYIKKLRWGGDSCVLLLTKIRRSIMFFLLTAIIHYAVAVVELIRYNTHISISYRRIF